jgi:peroxiredoxin
VELHTKFGAPGPDSRIKLPEFCKGKKVILVGLPGAFTPT